MALLEVQNLGVRFSTPDGMVTASEGLTYHLDSGETMSIVGESGSGKSVSCLALMHLIPTPPGQVNAQKMLFDGIDLRTIDRKTMRSLRGNQISMVFQDPMSALNPYLRVRDQLAEPLLLHQKQSRQHAKEQVLDMLERVGVRNAAARLRHYPHQFSGGERQRIIIAMALLTRPKLLIADEPTTALDVTVQAQILELLKTMQRELNIAMLFISHDLAVVADVSDKIIVMEKGRVVEHGEANQVLRQPTQPYTQSLLAAIPTGAKANPVHIADDQARLLSVNGITVSYNKGQTQVKAVDDIHLHVCAGEILGLVGESGCGKTTLSRTIMRLLTPTEGTISLDGSDITHLSPHNMVPFRRKYQMVFQDPYSSLNPRMTVGDVLREPINLHQLADIHSIDDRITTVLTDVGLQKSDQYKYPHQFSIGQCQRIAIARTLVVRPQLIIADEPVSALDVTIQAHILELLLQIVEKYNLGMIFISHDLSVVRNIADRTLVMHNGRIVEEGETQEIFNRPQQPYTQQLIASIPTALPQHTAPPADGK